MVRSSFSAAEARRIALAAQGFGRSTAQGPTAEAPGARRLNTEITRLGLLQLDSVNVFERSHYLPLFSRLGAYDKATLDRLVFARPSSYIEYWAHEAALIPVHTWPLMRWRMQRQREKSAADVSDWSHRNRPMLDWLLSELAEKGPLAARAIEHDATTRTGPWWGWSDVKIGLETLFRWGDVVSAGRTRFERVYALPEQVLPTSVLNRDVSAADARRMLVEHSARASGVGTTSDLADYFRLRVDETTAALRDLEEAGIVSRVDVEGWGPSAWLHRDARVPRRVEAAALLSPFDPVVWRRERALRMFGFHYRIEIYTPAPKRLFGYYSLPILIDDALVGRIDLKSDRKRGVLMVQSAWTEADVVAPDVAGRVAGLVCDAGAWQGLGGIEVADRGTLAGSLLAELSLRPSSGVGPPLHGARAATR